MLYVKTISDISLAANLLKSNGLTIPENVDYTAGVFDDDVLVGTASLKGDIIQGAAVMRSLQGEGISAMLMTHIINHAVESGLKTLYIFTLYNKTEIFQRMGFRLVAEAPPYVSLLEWGVLGIGRYGQYLAQCAEEFNNIEAAGIVMNCNPFTLGHRYLIEQAASENNRVYILLVEEDVSQFPFNVRFDLVRRGVADLKNVTLLRGGRYVVSMLTFPSYFSGDENVAVMHSAIDCEIFAKHIAPRLNIVKRYVGSEPYSKVTSIYNKTMKNRLIPKGIDIIEIERKEVLSLPVSASRVRSLIAQGKIEETRNLVPPVTFEYLISREAIK